MSLKKLISLFLIGYLFISEVCPFPQIITYIYMSHKFDLSGDPTYSDHTVAVNVDSKTTEDAYTDVRHTLNVDYVKDKVFIVRVATKPDGAIGSIGKDEVLGVYCHNLIVYDGDIITLKHELAHFFFEKMKEYDQSEMFAQITEKFFYLFPTFTHHV